MKKDQWKSLLEVAVAFVVMHLTFRLIKKTTSWGAWEAKESMNFAPGFVMIAVAILAWSASRLWTPSGSRAGAFRLGIKRCEPYFGAVICVSVFGVLGLILQVCGLDLMAAKDDWVVASAMGLASLLGTGLLLPILAKFCAGDASESCRGTQKICMGLVMIFVLVPFWVTLLRPSPNWHSALTILWLFFGAALGEELFFRGYMQTRLNESFGRPWQILGQAFGPGLLIASGFFGLIHLLNTWDYLGGQGALSWHHGATTALSLQYGFLRERYQSLCAPVAVHYLMNLGPRLAILTAIVC